MNGISFLVAGSVLMQWLPALQAQPDLTAEARIYESTTAHNAYPDDCDMRLQRLYIAEDLELSIEVQFSRDLSDEESQAVEWELSDGGEVLASGDFGGLGNPALLTTTVTAGPSQESTLRVMYQGIDLAPPAPLRVISHAEYDAAYAALSRVVGDNRFPLSADLLARFLGQESTAAGVPSVATEPLNICDPRLTHRAGADWGPDMVTNVPLVEYGPDQPATDVVAEGVAVALLSANAEDIRQYFAASPTEESHAFEFVHDGNLTLNFPPDAALALHGVQFDGTLSATVEAPRGSRTPLHATDVYVSGTVGDVYDFNLEATGAGAFPAIEAAKLEIASINHDIGKVFLVAFNLDSLIPSLQLDASAVPWARAGGPRPR
jgi:hypothetical protein